MKIVMRVRSMNCESWMNCIMSQWIRCPYCTQTPCALQQKKDDKDICDCFYDENGDRWYCEDCQYEDELDQE